MSIPIVISQNGLGLPVRAVESGAPVMQVAENGLGIPIVLSDLGAPFVVQGLDVWTPRSLFASGEQGAFYDPSDLSTLFQDHLGTTPAAFGQPVGLMLDKSGNGNHASQATATARPTLGRAPKGGRRNLLTFTEDLTNAVWSSNNSPSTELSAGPTPGFTTVSFTATSTDRRLPRFQSAFPDLQPGDVRYIRGVFRPGPGMTTIALGARTGAQFAHTAYNIITGETTGLIVFAPGYTEFVSATQLSPGEWELVVKYFAGNAPQIDIYANFGTGTAQDLRSASPIGSCEIGFMQASVEPGPYQRVTTDLDVSEAGVESLHYLSFDGVDDALTTTFPAGVTGDLLIAGRNGSWIEPVSIPAGGTLNIGPTGTPGTPGILRAVRDIVGWTAIDKTLSEAERQALIGYYREFGAKGLLVPGPELGFSGNMAVSDMTLEGCVAEDRGDRIRITKNIPAGTVGSAAIDSAPVIAGRYYAVSYEVLAVGANNNIRSWVNNGGGTGFWGLTHTYSVALFRRAVDQATGAGNGRLRLNLNISRGSNPANAIEGDWVEISKTFSVRELRPQEDWT